MQVERTNGTRAEPERELVRRAAPYSLPAAILAFTIGSAAGGLSVGWSAALGITVVALNLVVSGVSLALAARVSLTVLFGTALIGFVVRMAAIVAAMYGLNRFDWFSPLAFGLAVVPATLLLLAYEMRLLARGLDGALIVAPEAAVSLKGRGR
jgi:ATP synthase protein I